VKAGGMRWWKDMSAETAILRLGSHVTMSPGLCGGEVRKFHAFVAQLDNVLVGEGDVRLA
jgi:hypothetical protein